MLRPASRATVGGEVTAIEWRGRAGAVARADGFGLVEIIDHGATGGGWRLAFDTLSLQGAPDVVALRDHLQVRGTAGLATTPGAES